MVSLWRSHCHSASETFMGRPCSVTRVRTVRRTSSSCWRSWSATATSPDEARRTMRCVARVSAASWRVQPWQPRPHFLSSDPPSADTCPRSWPRSTSTITGSSSASGSGGCQVKYSSRFPLNRTSTTEVKSLLGECTHRKVLLLTPLEELFDAHPGELAQLAPQRLAQRLGRGVGVGVCAAGGLGDDLVDHAEREEVGCGELQRLGGPFLLAGVFPEDRRAALGRDHRIHRVLEHHDAVRHADGERPARSPLTDHRGE